LNYNSESEYDFKGGWGKKNGNIIMPISPKLLLITQIGSDLDVAQLDYSEHWSKFFRKIIIEHAHRYVYAIKPQKGMLAINPRRVNSEQYAREKTIMAGWHDEQMESEAQLR
jgi:Fe-S cluster assembly ATPase SufC